MPTATSQPTQRERWIGPRLLVPIVVEALVVDASQTNRTWAETRFGAVTKGEPPPPFLEQPKRAKGVHLHWSLPDALTKGRVKKGQNVSSRSAASGTEGEDPETLIQYERPSGRPQVPGNTLSIPAGMEARVRTARGSKRLPTVHDLTRGGGSTDTGLELPIMPDRWLVLRMHSDRSNSRLVSGWVLALEDRIVNGVENPGIPLKAEPLATWVERPDDGNPRWFTPLGQGDAAFVAYYDNVKNVLGFHDDLSLEPTVTGPLAYLVAGWYSRPSEDPAYDPTGRGFQAERKPALGRRHDDLSAFQRCIDALQEDLGLKLVGASNGLAPAQQAMNAYQHWEKTRGDNSTASESRSGFANLLCHGMVYDVSWNGGSDRCYPDLANLSGVPASSSVRVAVGNSSAEALAAVLARSSGEEGLEPLLASLQLGQLSALDGPDFLARVENLLHASAFEAVDAGFTWEDSGPAAMKTAVNFNSGSIHSQLPSGAAVEVPISPSTPAPGTVAWSSTGGGRPNPSSATSTSSGTVPQSVGQPSTATAPAPKRVWKRRPLPRYWAPADPVVVLFGAGRSYKHGADGRFEQDQTLAVRLTGQTLEALPVPVSTFLPEHPTLEKVLRAKLKQDPRVEFSAYSIFKTLYHVAQPAKIGSTIQGVVLPKLSNVPPEIEDLLAEALLLDEARAPFIALQLFAHSWAATDRLRPEARPKEPTDLEPMVRYVQQRWQQGGIDFTDQVKDVADFDNKSGVPTYYQVPPSPQAVLQWRPAWTPLHLEWEIHYAPTAGLTDWTLTEHEYLLKHGAAPGRVPIAFTGRSLLTPAPARTLERMIRTLLEAETSGKQDEVGATAEQKLEDTRRVLEELDVLSASLEEFHTRLAEATSSAWRMGHAVLSRVRVVDCFGQYIELPTEEFQAPFKKSALKPLPIRAESLEPWVVGTGAPSLLSYPHLLQLPPRLLAPARLMFRFLDVSNEQNDAQNNAIHSPIAGWILPDHLDEALEIYDRDGRNLGQIQARPETLLEPTHTVMRGWGVEWHGPPGQSGDSSAMLAGAHPALLGFIEGIRFRGNQEVLRGEDRLRGKAEGPDPTHPVVTALLRLIDATRWTIDPVGDEENAILSALAGHPLALVRARVSLEMPPEAATKLKGQRFPVRLGELTSLQDGLMGYFVEDPQYPTLMYRTFYPVHESLAADAQVSGPNEGFFGTVSGEVLSKVAREPVRHVYLSEAPSVYLEPNRPVTLTLLVDPRGGVHATCGFLPRKRVDLTREQYVDSLQRMVLSYRVGPVLGDPKAIRMPIDGDPNLKWSWIDPQGASKRIDPSDERPHQSGRHPALLEGWIQRARSSE